REQPHTLLRGAAQELLLQLLVPLAQLENGAHLRPQHLRFDRPDDVVGRAVLRCHARAVRPAGGGDEQDGNVAVARARADEVRRLESILPWHVHVEQDQRAAVGQQELERFLARADLHETLLEGLERSLESHQVRRIIIHQQYRPRFHRYPFYNSSGPVESGETTQVYCAARLLPVASARTS